jgi:Ca-activated chloride channel family protein
MCKRTFAGIVWLAILAVSVRAQHLDPAPSAPRNPFDELQLVMAHDDAEMQHRELGSPSSSVSVLDLKAPEGARREYDKGLRLLLQKNFDASVPHLAKSIAVYPAFVAAHNALGCAYLDLGQNDQAMAEFRQAVSLDDHLPRSHLNLGRAELALSHYGEAEKSFQKASLIDPLNLSLRTVLAYTQYMGHDYKAAIATANSVHAGKHSGASVVHYLAAASWQAENNLPEAQRELQLLLNEEPQSPFSGAARGMMAQIEAQRTQPPPAALAISYTPSSGGASARPGEFGPQALKILQELREQNQVETAACDPCEVTKPQPSAEADAPNKTISDTRESASNSRGFVLRSAVDEVAVFFAATDHGRSITDLTREDIRILDDREVPVSVTGFRNEGQLPLRLGLLIDTSASITDRFAFEQEAASSFLERLLTDENDLGFVVGFSNSILLVQDLTSEATQLSHGISQLAPGGGTAIWDTIVFAAEKLSKQPRVPPVANILVVISDGDDNSSTATLEEAIESAERAQLTVYAVSTKEANPADSLSTVGNRALKILGERTGGTAFFPGSVGHLKGSLAQLQEIIRSRYLISYKPASFVRDGRYRTIEITAHKSDRKLHVYARKGYYALAKTGATEASTK